MYRHLLRVLCITTFSTVAYAGDGVSTWLQHMGCEQLLASYYEELLEHGDHKEKVSAATELANLYAILLSRASASNDEAMLQRASSLLKRMPEGGTIDLRIQLLRAGYLSSEQLLEKYRLRFVDKKLADDAVIQLTAIASSFERLRDVFIRKARSSKSENVQNSKRLGLVTSLLAWSKYYISWHAQDTKIANEAALLFAAMIQSEKATLQHVSLDFKTFDYGARAILGIALCKNVLNDPAGSSPWLEELQDLTTWPLVRMQVPMWTFFIDIDNRHWQKVLDQMHSVDDMDKILILRLAIVHALEDSKNSSAQKVATKAIESLIQLGQLGIVSKIVEAYGFAALPPRGFITRYIKGDLAYRTLRDEMQNEGLSTDPAVINKYLEIASTLKEAMRSSDIKQFQQLADDCSYMLGLSLFHASSFKNAAAAFTNAANGDSAERAIWMAIVCLDHVDNSLQVATLKEVLVTRYISSWPNTPRATKLLLHQSKVATVSSDRLQDLLEIPQTDPQYHDAQEQACRLLYKSWQSVSPSQRTKIGNQYVFTAVPLMLQEHNLLAKDIDTNRLAVRAFRILEVSLHQDVSRIIAAENAFNVLEDLQQSGHYEMNSQSSEFAYRKILLSLIARDADSYLKKMKELSSVFPNDPWTVSAAKAIWNYWQHAGEQINDELRFQIGIQILYPLSDSEITNSNFAEIAHKVAQAGSNANETNANVPIAQKSLQIARLLIAVYPQNAQILQLNSSLETSTGDKAIALSHWRTIASGSKRGGLNWLEARFHIITALAKSEPIDALAILEQHHALYPSYGVDPFGTQLRKLHQRLQGVRDES